jgi:hypothetical protein
MNTPFYNVAFSIIFYKAFVNKAFAFSALLTQNRRCVKLKVPKKSGDF